MEIGTERHGHVSNVENGKSTITQWIVADTFGLKDLNIENNNFREPVDLPVHSIHGMIDVKSSTFDGYRWKFSNMYNMCDTFLFLCMDKNVPWKNIERSYAIPCDEIFGETTISIVKNPFRIQKWRLIEEFRIDEKPFNDTYHKVDIPRYFSPFDLWNGKYNKILE